MLCVKYFGILHLAKENEVVPAGIDLDRLTLHNRKSILQKRCSQFTFKVEAGRPIGVPLGEQSRNLLLMFGKHTDPELLRTLESPQAAEMYVQADEYDQEIQ